MIRGLLMFRGALIIRGPLTTGRTPDSWWAIFIGPLTVLRVPDSQRGPDIQKGNY